jgi:hypothetical protein
MSRYLSDESQPRPSTRANCRYTWATELEALAPEIQQKVHTALRDDYERMGSHSTKQPLFKTIQPRSRFQPNLRITAGPDLGRTGSDRCQS